MMLPVLVFFFNCLIVFHFIFISHFLYPFTNNGYLGCFQFCAIMNNATMNICMKSLSGHMSLFILGGYVGVELLGYMVITSLTFEKLPNRFPK